MRVLNFIRQKKVNTATEIAEIIGITAASMTTHIDYLIENKWVSRKPSKKDKRIKELELTVRGKIELIKIGKRIVGEFSKMMSVLSKSEIKAFLKIIDKIESNINS